MRGSILLRETTQLAGALPQRSAMLVLPREIVNSAALSWHRKGFRLF
jgi:hypothetical protein